MRVTRRGVPALALALLLAAGCAAVPTEMHYDTAAPAAARAADGGTQDAENARVWPGPPEPARYRYLGTLVGEANFRTRADARRGVGARVLRWVAGIDEDRRAASRRMLARPQAGMVGADGRIYVTDVGRHAVFVFDETAGRLEVWGQADRRDNFDTPIGIVDDAQGGLLVADAKLRRIVRLDAQGRPLGSFGEDVLERPAGMARDPDSGRLYVADSAAHDIKVFTAEGALERRIGRRGILPGEFNAPTFVAFRAGRLYVSDTLNARVQVLEADGTPAQAIGRRGLYVGNLTRPKGLEADADGNVYVIESYYDHLLVFDRDGRFLLPVGGSGAAIGQFYLPSGVWLDARGRVFVADTFNGRVVVLQALGT